MTLPNYISKSTKKKSVLKVINEALHILDTLDIPLNNLTSRRLEKMAMAFLAVANVKTSHEWTQAKINGEGWAPQTRQIIDFVNENFEENISKGSYDDIRRKDLKLATIAEIVVRSANNPNAATNNPTRGYSINSLYASVVRSYGSKNWKTEAQKVSENVGKLSDRLSGKRNLDLIKVKVSKNLNLTFSPGEHNQLQKDIVEQFLPRYGFGSEVLYIGDTAKKFLIYEEDRLSELNFFKLSHDELPDVIAYSRTKNWLYLIEAVHSSGPINSVRLEELNRLTKDCKADIVYVTAFLDRVTFRKFAPYIAWETEVWIAQDPDHMIHFNGDKFLGPYKG